MNDEFKVEELKAWMLMYEDKSYREGSPSIHLSALMARADGMVNTNLITWEEWRELEFLANALYQLTIEGKGLLKRGLNHD
ncbi:hypothetical protein [Pseudomonas sp. SG20052]|uniref:hypothetical protein n=1 Tax=Pseudomonas sp. SG20052 TaxID=3074147 RepID=UPI00287F59E8|nr:hypothetical protein [Pseudomonas sp. SG20052]WNF58540.1 hypothetical protein RHP74_15020 [Pseudomonas sp. SG20052]